MDNLVVMKVLNSKKNLKHPSGYHFFSKQPFRSNLSLEMILQIAVLAILLDDVGPIALLYNLMQGNDVGMMQGFH